MSASLYRFAARYDPLWWLYCKVHEVWCLLRGPHQFQPIHYWTDLYVCQRCPVWASRDGWFWGWYR